MNLISRIVRWLFLFYILAAYKIVSGQLATCYSAQSWGFYNVALLGNLATNTVMQYPTHSHYPGTELSSPCPVLFMPSARLGNDKYQLYKSLI